MGTDRFLDLSNRSIYPFYLWQPKFTVEAIHIRSSFRRWWRCHYLHHDFGSYRFGAGHDIVRQLVPLMANPFWFATAENEWEDLFFRFVPDWLAVSDRRILQGYFEGDEDFWQQRIGAWLIPILAWTALWWYSLS